MTDPVYDGLYEEYVIPCRCSCCEKCWLYVTHTRPRFDKRGTCVHGGHLDPSRGWSEYYMGYARVE